MKRLPLALCLALLVALCAGFSALADAQTIQLAAPEEVMSAWVDTENTPFDLSDWIGDASIDNYDELMAFDDSDVEWAVSALDDDPPDGAWRWESRDSGDYVSLFVNYDKYQPQAGDVWQFLITARWNGKTRSAIKTINFVDPGVLPDGITGVPEDSILHMQVGQVYTLSFAWDPDFDFGGHHEAMHWINEAEDLNDYLDWEDIRDDDGNCFGIDITPKVPGVFFGGVGMQQGNLNCYYDVVYSIADEDGTVPDVGLRFEGDEGSNRNVQHWLFDDDDNTGLHHQNLVTTFAVDDNAYNVLCLLYGEPQWSHNLTGGNQDVIYSADYWDDGRDSRGIQIQIEESPNSPCSAEITVTCAWPDTEYSLTGTVEVQFVEPTGDLPTGMWVDGQTDDGEIHGLIAGEWAGFNVHWLPNNTIYYPDNTWLDFDIDCDGEWYWDWDDEGNRVQHFMAHEPGVYWAEFSLNDGNLRMSREVLLYVGDESGDEPAIVPTFEDEGQYEQWREQLLFEENDETGLYHMTYVAGFDIKPNAYDALQFLCGAPEWTFQVVSEGYSNDIFSGHVEDDGEDTRRFHLEVEEYPEKPCNVDVTVTASWPDTEYSVSGVVHVNFVNLYFDLPTGMTIEGMNENGEIHGLCAGEWAGFSVGWEPESFHYDDGGTWLNFNTECDGEWYSDDENSIQYFKAYNPGVYRANIAINEGTLHMSRDVMLFVQDENGEEPSVSPILNWPDQDIALSLPVDGPHSDAIILESFLFDVNLENYDVIRTYYDADPDWRIDPQDDDLPGLRLESDDNRHYEVLLDSYPDHELSANYVLRISVNGEDIVTRNIYLDFVNCDFPEDVVVDRAFDLEVGETIQITAAFAPAEYQGHFDEPHVNIGINDFNGDFNDCIRFECEGDTITVTGLVPGTYVAWIDMVDGNIIATTYETVVFRVSDESGHVPSLNPEFEEDAYEMTMVTSVSNPGDLDNWIAEGEELFIRPINSEQLEGLYGDNYEWSFETIQGKDVDMYVVRDDNGDFNFCISNLSSHQPGTTSVVNATLQYSCDDCVGSATLPITINFIRLTLPNSIEWDSNITMRAGEEYHTNMVIEPSNWSEGFLWYNVWEEDWRIDRWEDENDSLALYLRCNTPGTYRGDCHIHAYNVFIWGPNVLYKVEDENGNVPMTEMTLPSSLQVIEEEAFMGIAANVVYVPSGVTRIESRAFADSLSLMEVHIPSGADCAEDAFDGCPNVNVIRY